MASSSVKDISGAFMGGQGASFVPSLTGGGSSAYSQSGDIKTTFSGGDIATGGSKIGVKIPTIYWIGGGILLAALAYRYYKKHKK